MKTQLYYITDTYCCWCFGFSKTVNSLAKDYDKYIDLGVLNGCMIPNSITLESFFNRFPDPIGVHDYISSTSNRKFGEPYLKLIRDLKGSNRLLNSNIPAKALISLQILGVNALVAATKIQNTYYEKGVDLQKMESYQAIVESLGLSFELFKATYSDAKVTMKLIEELDLVRKMYVRGYPAIVAKAKNGSYKLIASGFMPYEQLKVKMDEILMDEQDSYAIKGNICALDGTGCT